MAAPSTDEIRESIRRRPYAIQAGDVGRHGAPTGRRLGVAVLCFLDAVVLIAIGGLGLAFGAADYTDVGVLGAGALALGVATFTYGVLAAAGHALPRFRVALWVGHAILILVVSVAP